MFDQASRGTGISRATLTNFCNVPGDNTNTDTLDALGCYFEMKGVLELRDDEE